MTAPSSKALFRATKAKRPVQGPALIPDLHDARSPEEKRRSLDFYPTGQPEAIRALLSADGARIRQLGSAWEPAAGKGDMVREIKAHGIPCMASDVHDHGCPGVTLRSFYDWQAAPGPVMITNPPYAEVNARDGHGRWLRHMLAMPGWRYSALLLSWDWPAARQNGLGAMLDIAPFSWCYLMRWKLDFTGEGSPPQRNAWFVWDRDDLRSTRDPALNPSFRWLDRLDARQGELL